jgi:hypothetical protein
MKVKTPREDMKEDVAYKVPCMDCDTSYIRVGETGRDLHMQIVEHKAAIRRKDDKNGIAVHANVHNHHVDWKGAKILEQDPRYWRRRRLEAIHILKKKNKSNLDCGLALNTIWTPFLER